MNDKKSIFEKITDRVKDFYHRILPTKNRKKLILITVTTFILYATMWISIVLSLMSFGLAMIFLLISVMTVTSIFTLTPLLSVTIESVKVIDSQFESYRRDQKNKGKLFVNFGDGEGWKEFSFGYPDTTQSFKKIAEKAGFDTEMGGEDDNQKKTRLRNNKINDILKDKLD